MKKVFDVSEAEQQVLEKLWEQGDGVKLSASCSVRRGRKGVEAADSEYLSCKAGGERINHT